tara:strand:- start:9 stop:605 length:597 start_codon:yes stop_codon:yes gene_type:complete
MSTPFKMNMPSYGQGKNPIQKSESPAKFIYGKAKETTNKDGSTTKTRKNIFTGGTKATTKRESVQGEGRKTTSKTVQKMNKDKSKGTVKVKTTKTNNILGDRKIKTKSKISNFKGTDDYKVTSQKQTRKVKGVRGSKTTKKNTGGSIKGVESGFSDPRLHKSGEFMTHVNHKLYPSSYRKANEKDAKDKKNKKGIYKE